MPEKADSEVAEVLAEASVEEVPAGSAAAVLEVASAVEASAAEVPAEAGNC